MGQAGNHGGGAGGLVYLVEKGAVGIAHCPEKAARAAVDTSRSDVAGHHTGIADGAHDALFLVEGLVQIAGHVDGVESAVGGKCQGVEVIVVEVSEARCLEIGEREGAPVVLLVIGVVVAAVDVAALGVGGHRDGLEVGPGVLVRQQLPGIGVVHAVTHTRKCTRGDGEQLAVGIYAAVVGIVLVAAHVLFQRRTPCPGQAVHAVGHVERSPRVGVNHHACNLRHSGSVHCGIRRHCRRPQHQEQQQNSRCFLHNGLIGVR